VIYLNYHPDTHWSERPTSSVSRLQELEETDKDIAEYSDNHVVLCADAYLIDDGINNKEG
jgi:hypothetical protein